MTTCNCWQPGLGGDCDGSCQCPPPEKTTVILGECVEAMRQLGRAGLLVDSIVCDPPYHLESIVKRFGKTTKDTPGKVVERINARADGMARVARGFMGQTWDGGDVASDPETWRQAYAVLKPGGHLLAFGGTRTFHRMACAIEDAGFEIRDCLMWVYGSGFPKSHDVSKGIDKTLGSVGTITPTGNPVKRMIPGADQNATGSWIKDNGRIYQPGEYVPSSKEAAKWQGWGTALKPAWEPIIMARKPLIGTVAQNVLEYGTGAINIDGCRIPFAGAADEKEAKDKNQHVRFSSGARTNQVYGKDNKDRMNYDAAGRWPANLLHDGSDEVEASFAHYGETTSTGGQDNQVGLQKFRGQQKGVKEGSPGYGDTGSVSRYFYCAKANKAERCGSSHPTVKPIALMRWLVRLVTPPGGLVLDPFAGTGSTLQAALQEGFRALGIEREEPYVQDIVRRLAA